MKKIFLLICLIFGISCILSAQQRLKGYQKVINSYGERTYNFSYTRSFSSSDNWFFTTYKIYNTSNKHIITITAKHQVDMRRVTVDVSDPNGGIFSRINTEEHGYSRPTLEPFGIVGNFRILAGDDVPSQLALQFTNNKYQAVKVISVYGTRPGSMGTTHGFVFYVFPDEFSKVDPKLLMEERRLEEKREREQKIQEEIAKEKQRREDEEREKAEIAGFLKEREHKKYNYADFHKENYLDLKKNIEKSLDKLLVETSSDVEKTALKVIMSIDTNSNTTSSLLPNKDLPNDFLNQANKMLSEYKLLACSKYVHGKYAVMAEAEFDYELLRKTRQEKYIFSYYKDDIISEEGNHQTFPKDEIAEDIKAKKYSYGTYDIVYSTINVNNKSHTDIHYTGYKGLGGGANAFLSVVVPGLGSKYTSRESSSLWYLKTIGILGLAGGGMYFKAQSDTNYKEYQFVSSQDEMDEYYEKANTQNKLSRGLIGAAAVWWLYDIINTGIDGGANRKETKRMRKILAPQIISNQSGNIYGLTYQLKF